MDNNQNNPQEVPQIKSVDNISEEQYWKDYNEHLRLKLNISELHFENNTLQSRIAELEAENDKYREALENTDELLSRLEDYTHGRDGVDITTTRNNIQQALKTKVDG